MNNDNDDNDLLLIAGGLTVVGFSLVVLILFKKRQEHKEQKKTIQNFSSAVTKTKILSRSSSEPIINKCNQVGIGDNDEQSDNDWVEVSRNIHKKHNLRS